VRRPEFLAARRSLASYIASRALPTALPRRAR